MSDANIDEPPFGALPPHLIAEEPRSRRNPDRNVEMQRLACVRGFGIERRIILGLQAMQHTDHWLLDDDPKIDGDLI